MVRHDAVRKKRNLASLESCAQNSFESFVVLVALKESRPFCGSIPHVKYKASCGQSSTSRHGEKRHRNQGAASSRASEMSPDPISVFEK
jgi:hypothetical protein